MSKEVWIASATQKVQGSMGGDYTLVILPARSSFNFQVSNIKESLWSWHTQGFLLIANGSVRNYGASYIGDKASINYQSVFCW